MFKPYDLFVCNTDSIYSKLINFVQTIQRGSSTCTHVGVVVDVSNVPGINYPKLCLLEATKIYDDEPRDIRPSKSNMIEGVFLRDLESVIEYCMNKQWKMYRLRPYKDVSNAIDISPILFKYWRSHYQFSPLEMLSSRYDITVSDNVYCSQLAAIVYKHIGLYKGPVGLTPEELISTGLFNDVMEIY